MPENNLIAIKRGKQKIQGGHGSSLRNSAVVFAFIHSVNTFTQ